MTEADKHIQNILSSKLDKLETPVKPGIWDNIAAQIPSAPVASATTTSVTGISTFMKVAAAVLIIGAAAVTGLLLNQEKNNPTIPAGSKASAPTQNEQLQKQSDSSTASQRIVNENQTAPDKKSGGVFSDKDHQKRVGNTANYYNSPGPSGNQDLVQPTNQLPSEPKTQEPKISVKDNNPDLTNQGSQLQPGQGLSSMNRIDTSAPIFSIQAKEIDPKRLMYFFFCGADLKSVEWFIDGEKITETKTFNHSFDQEGTYDIRLKSVLPNNQIDEKSITLEVVKPLEFNIPNVFTPGKDGLNDTFDIAKAIENEKEILRLIIQDRAGKVVFDSDNLFVWNGRYTNGELCPAGVYTYSVLLTDKKNNSQTKSGTIQLFRE